jgi:hypothetical protein
MAERLLLRHPSLVYELSARTWPRHPRSPEYTILTNGERVWPEWRALVESMRDRFVVGTDASGRSSAADVERIRSVTVVLDQLSPGTRSRVAHETLEFIVRRVAVR